MFELFKKRAFSELISDTFSFFKATGKHYFTSYLTLNGGLLMILMVLFYFVFKVYFEFLFSSIGVNNQNGFNDTLGADFIDNNVGLALLIVGIILVLMLLISAISYSFPVLYMKLYEERNGNSFSSLDVLKLMKKNAKKIIVFFLTLLFLTFTVGLLIMGLVFLLVMIIIGIPLLLIILPTVVLLINVSLYHYLNSDIGVFQAFGKGIEYIKLKFWPSVGSTICMYFIVQIISTIFTMIPYLIGVFTMFTNQDATNHAETLNVFSIMMIITVVLSVVISYILNNLILVNSGLVYYSVREELEKNVTKSDIDLIGTE